MLEFLSPIFLPIWQMPTLDMSFKTQSNSADIVHLTTPEDETRMKLYMFWLLNVLDSWKLINYFVQKELSTCDHMLYKYGG
jgi:hypothetical protein